MARYGQAFKNKVVAKLLPPNTASLEEVSRDSGVLSPSGRGRTKVRV